MVCPTRLANSSAISIHPPTSLLLCIPTATLLCTQQTKWSRRQILLIPLTALRTSLVLWSKLDPSDVLPARRGSRWRGYTWHHFPQARRSGGLAFLIREDAHTIHSVRLDLSYNVEGAGFQCAATGDDKYDQATHRNSGLVWLEARKAHQPSALYGLLYLHPNADLTDWQQLRSSLQAAAHTELPIFRLGDFNIHSPRWGDRHTRSSRLTPHLLAACEDFDWDVLNELHAFGEETHQERRWNHFGPGRIIDLGLSSQQLGATLQRAPRLWSALRSFPAPTHCAARRHSTG